MGRSASESQTHWPIPLAAFQELKKWDIYAGDGHWHGAAAHDKSKDGRKWAVGHFYTLNMRSHAMNHLEMANEVERKHEHDMRALKGQIHPGVEAKRAQRAQGALCVGLGLLGLQAMGGLETPGRNLLHHPL